jgi:hypothetical protein
MKPNISRLINNSTSKMIVTVIHKTSVGKLTHDTRGQSVRSYAVKQLFLGKLAGFMKINITRDWTPVELTGID